MKTPSAHPFAGPSPLLFIFSSGAVSHGRQPAEMIGVERGGAALGGGGQVLRVRGRVPAGRRRAADGGGGGDGVLRSPARRTRPTGPTPICRVLRETGGETGLWSPAVSARVRTARRSRAAAEIQSQVDADGVKIWGRQRNVHTTQLELAPGWDWLTVSRFSGSITFGPRWTIAGSGWRSKGIWLELCPERRCVDCNGVRQRSQGYLLSCL